MNLINKNDSIFIAGHKGMVGSAIKRSLEQNNYNNLLLSSRDDLDLADNQAVKNWFKKNKPDIVILAAAKVGGIYANNTYPTDFLLENLKIQNNVIENCDITNTLLANLLLLPLYEDVFSRLVLIRESAGNIPVKRAKRNTEQMIRTIELMVHIDLNVKSRGINSPNP